MKAGWWVLVSTVVLLALLGTEAEAGRTLREFSGDAMQRHDSRMMASPLMRYPDALPWSIRNIPLAIRRLSPSPLDDDRERPDPTSRVKSTAAATAN